MDIAILYIFIYIYKVNEYKGNYLHVYNVENMCTN